MFIHYTYIYVYIKAISNPYLNRLLSLEFLLFLEIKRAVTDEQ